MKIRGARVLAFLRRGVPLTLLFGFAVLFSLPLYLLVVVSLKTPAETAKSPFSLPSSLQWENYIEAWQKNAGSGTASLAESMINSATITFLSVLLIIVVGGLGGFFLGRHQTRLSNVVYTIFLIAISLPIQLIVISIYPVLSALGLMGETWVMVLFYTGLLTPFSIFLFTGFVRNLPRDFDEAARLDGCNWIQVIFYVVGPLLLPVSSTVSILTGIAIWNDFFGQLIFLLGSGNETLPITIYTFSSQYSSQYHLLAAGLVLAMLPMVTAYLLLQRRIVEGFSSGIRG